MGNTAAAASSFEVNNYADIDKQVFLTVEKLFYTPKAKEAAEVFEQGVKLLQRRNFKQALSKFEDVVSECPDDGNAYFCVALCLLDGKRPFLSKLPTIKLIIENLDTALSFEEKGAYYFLKAVVCRDYYEAKKMQCTPSNELFRRAAELGLTKDEMSFIRQTGCLPDEVLSVVYVETDNI